MNKGWIFQVILRGEVDSVTGMVFDLAELKQAMAEVMDIIDHRNIDKDISHFKVGSSSSGQLTFWPTQCSVSDHLSAGRTTDNDKNISIIPFHREK